MKNLIFFKTLILIFLLSSLNLNTFSQLKHFLPDSNSYFSVSPYKFWFNGDTIINDLKFKKVFMQIDDSIADFKKASYYASIREDTIAEKIYCIQVDDNIERLIADFSVDSGESVTVYSYWPVIYAPVNINLVTQSVDSIMINNSYYKRINFKHERPFSEDYIETWIEGIGSSYGLFFPAAILLSSEIDYPHLLCIHRDDTLFFQNSNYSICYMDFITNIKQTENELFHIYPTYAHDKLYVSTTEQNKRYQYSIIDNLGKLLYKGELNKSYIDILFLHKGFYLITILNDKKTKIYTNKFFKF